MPDNWIGRILLTQDYAVRDARGGVINEYLPCDGSALGAESYPVLRAKLVDDTAYVPHAVKYENQQVVIQSQYTELNAISVGYDYRATDEPTWERRYSRLEDGRSSDTGLECVPVSGVLTEADLQMGVCVSFTWHNQLPWKCYAEFVIGEQSLRIYYSGYVDTDLELQLLVGTEWVKQTAIPAVGGGAVVSVVVHLRDGVFSVSMTGDRSMSVLVDSSATIGVSVWSPKLVWASYNYWRVVAVSRILGMPDVNVPNMPAPTGSPNPYKIIADKS